MRDDGREQINIFGVFLDRVDYSKACKKAQQFLQDFDSKVIVTPNAEMIMAAQKNAELMKMLNSADMSLPDGIGVVIASRILGDPLLQRTTGFDFMMKLIAMAEKQGLSLFLLGGKPGIAQQAAEQIKAMFPGVNIAGTHHGYFKAEDEHNILDMINDKKPDILLVAMGFPKQEKFMIENKNKLRFRVAIGVGGSLDVLSGNVSRAPEFMQKAGLEWLYRLITQPWRFKRMTVLPLFLINAVFHRISGQNKV